MKKIVTISFDDGREDNYRNAWPVMKKNGLVGTFFVTTGYIDGDWETDKWLCSYGAMKVEQLQEMKSLGSEIAAHGNKHVSEIGDIDICIKKLKSWGLVEDSFGFSAPCSVITPEFRKHISQLGLQYMRLGRGEECSTFLYKCIHKLYGLTGSSWAYRTYYNKCINDICEINVDNIQALPMLLDDKVDDLIDFIDSCKNKWIVLMFHSILDEQESKYGQDNYCWSLAKFERLCAYLANNDGIEVKTIESVIKTNA